MFYKIIYAILRAVFFIIYPTRFYGRENIEKGAALICANHSDNLDVIFVAFSAGIGGKLAFLSKKELFCGEMVSRFLKSLGAIPIDRGNADIAAVKKCFGALKDGKKLVIFPEGTRHSDGEISDAKSGAGMFALRTGAPVIPIYVPAQKRLFRINKIIIGQPYIPSNAGQRGGDAYLAAAEEIMDKIRALKSAQNQNNLQIADSARDETGNVSEHTDGMSAD